jgi:hypothetical protein
LRPPWRIFWHETARLLRTLSGQQSDGLDKYERPIFTHREVDNEGIDYTRADLKPQCGQPIIRLAKFSRITLEVLDNLLEG